MTSFAAGFAHFRSIEATPARKVASSRGLLHETID